jgi:hypothetical protein
MRTWKILLHLLLTLLLSIGASSAVSAKVASGDQNPTWTGHQAESVFNWLTCQGKSDRSTTGPPECSVVTKGADDLGSFAHNYQRSAGAAQRVPNVLQTGGNTLNKRAANALNEQLGQNLNRREWGRALEGLKSELGLPGNHHARILDNGDYVDDAGHVLGNLLDYAP